MPKFARHAGVILALLLSAAVPAAAPDEYQVEAVFLLHFTQFIEWPAQGTGDPHTPFIIGVLGRDPFGSALDEAVRGETVNGRPLVVKRFAAAADLGPCQILFIDRSALGDADRVIASLSHSGTLTVSNFDVPAPADVIIRFLNEDRRIRLRINVDLRSESTKTLDEAPMSCCATPIKQARCCEEECAGANGHDTGPAPPSRLEESGNLAAFERAAKTRIAARGDQCVAGAALCRADISNCQIRHKADAGGCLERAALRSRDREVVGLPAQFIICAGKHLQGPSDVQHLAVWKCQH